MYTQINGLNMMRMASSGTPTISTFGDFNMNSGGFFVQNSTNQTNVSGLLNGQKMNWNLVQSYGGAAQNWKIATLPVSTSATFDHVVVDSLSGGWLSSEKKLIHAVFANRGVFSYSWTHREPVPTVAVHCWLITMVVSLRFILITLQERGAAVLLFQFNCR